MDNDQRLHRENVPGGMTRQATLKVADVDRAKALKLLEDPGALFKSDNIPNSSNPLNTGIMTSWITSNARIG